MSTWNYNASNVNDTIVHNGATYTGRTDGGQVVFDTTDNVHVDSDLDVLNSLIKQLHDKLQADYSSQVLADNFLDTIPVITSVTDKLAVNNNDSNPINVPAGNADIQIEHNDYVYRSRIDTGQTVYDVVTSSLAQELRDLISRLQRLIDNVKTASIKITNVEFLEQQTVEPEPPTSTNLQAKVKISSGSSPYFFNYNKTCAHYENGMFHFMPILVRATCSTLGLNNDHLGMLFGFQLQQYGGGEFEINTTGMSSIPTGNPYHGGGEERKYTCVYIRLLKYTGAGWYNVGKDNTQAHDVSVLKHPLPGVATHYNDSCVTAWAPAGYGTADTYFMNPATPWTNGIQVARNLGFDAIYGSGSTHKTYSSRASGEPVIGPAHTSQNDNVLWSDLFVGGFKINSFEEFGSDPAHRSPNSVGDLTDINGGFVDVACGRFGRCVHGAANQAGLYVKGSHDINGKSLEIARRGNLPGWDQVYKFDDWPAS